MTKYNILQLKDAVYHVGARDWNRRVFDALIPLPKGTSYNSYLIAGNNKTALIDTVNPGFEQILEGKINQITKITDLDYIVMNHAEPDHAGAIPYIFKRNEKVRLITSQRGKDLAYIYYEIPEERIDIVEDGNKLELGGKTLSFIEAPWLHWPETIFTFLQEDNILFPCDFFGSHISIGNFDDEVDDLIPYAKKYFGEIMMPFANKGQKALEKLSGYDIKMIAPSHGPVYKNPDRIINKYQEWTKGQTKEKVIIIYVSMWGSTEKMVKAILETLLKEKIEVVIYNMVNADIGEIAGDLVDSRAIVIGTPSVIGGMHPLMTYTASLLKVLKPPLKFAALLSSYGWSESASRQATEVVEKAKIELVGAHLVEGPPNQGDFQIINELGNKLANRLRQ